MGRKRDEETVLAKGASLRGDLRVEGNLQINGRVDGTIDAQGKVLVGPEGSVQGELRGETVTVAGRVEGEVAAREIAVVTEDQEWLLLARFPKSTDWQRCGSAMRCPLRKSPTT